MKEPKLGGRKSKPKMGARVKSETEQSAVTERDLAAIVDGVRQPRSGAGIVQKGDVITEDFLFDEKRTKGQLLNLSVKDFAAITRWAAERDRIPAMALLFENTIDGVPSRWAAIPIDVLRGMVERGQLEGGDG